MSEEEEELTPQEQQMQVDADERKKQIKDGWSEAEEARRRVGNGGCVPWTLPEYYVAYVSADTTNLSRRKNRRTKIYKPLP